MRNSDFLLPQPVADTYEWQLLGACRRGEYALFFAAQVEATGQRKEREHRAKELCLSCPVLTQCRQHALAVGEKYGIWGGMTAAERLRVVRAAARSDAAKR